MGNAQTCMNIALEAAQNAMSVEEISDLLKQMERIRQKKLAAGQLADLDKAVEDLAREMTDSMKIAAVMEKRNRIINIFAERERRAHFNNFAEDPHEGLKALNVGTQRDRMGGRLSVATRQRAMQAKLMGGVMAKLEQENLMPFVRGDIDREIAMEMSQLGRADGAGSPGISGVPEAAKIAKIFADAGEAARVMQNDAGAIIRKLPGYIINQQHAYDMFKMRRHGKEQVMQDLLNALDHDATFQGADPVEFLSGVVDGMMSGVHMRVDGNGQPGGSPFKGAFNLAKKASSDRVLHYRDSDAFMKVFEKYGQGSLMESVMSGLARAADNTGLMQVWGTNPRLAFEAERQRLLEIYRNKPELADQINSPFREYEFREVTGESRMVGSPRLAWLGSVIRGVQSMAKLGGAVISSLTDIPIQANSLRYNGKNLLESYGEILSTRVSGFSPEEKRQLGDYMGMTMESWMGSYASRFDSGDALPGTMSKMMNLFFKANLLNWWTDGFRMTGGSILSRHLADMAPKVWADVDPQLKRVLQQYQISEREWNVVRLATKKIGDRTFLTPDAIRELPDTVFHAYQSNSNMTAAQLRRTKEELENRLEAYFIDQVEYGIIQPDAGTRAMLNLGTQRGTPVGEALRMITQFKSFPVAVVQKVIGREVYGRGANGVRQMGSSELAGLAHIMVMGTVFGYAALAGKDLIKGRTPRDPSDPKTWAAAFVQGGGLGIYGDFIFGQYTRFGTSAVATLAGPTASTLDEIMGIWGRVREGDDVAAATFRTIINNTPFANIFYTRMALDYAILYDVQEMLNPGSLSRLEQRLQREQGQEFFFRPTTERATPFTGQ